MKQYNISIVGRPNVGKSTLFNRLSRTNRAVTTAIAGTTRDIIENKVEIGPYSCLLMDTGGIQNEKEEMSKAIRKKALSTLENSDLILFVVDCKNLTPEDQEISLLLRKYFDKVIVVINKVDDVVHDDLINNFYSLGWKTLIPISASHNRGVEDLKEEIENFLSNLNGSNEAEDLEETEAVKDVEGEEDGEGEPDNNIKKEKNERKISISIMGKPNTGKSSLSNVLLGADKSLVSPIAGTTRDVIEGEFEYGGYKFNLMDTAGIRRKGKVVEDIEYFSVNRAIKSIDSSDIVFLMIDCIEGITQQDKKIAELVVRNGVAVVIVLNKIDLLTVQNQYRAIVDRLRFLFPQLNFAPIVGISALNQEGIETLLKTAIKLKKQLDRKISTSALNKSLAEYNAHYSAPRSGKVYYKILYATQLDSSPVSFLFIVNKKRGFPETYISYIKNKIRAEYNIPNIPILVKIEERERK